MRVVCVVFVLSTVVPPTFSDASTQSLEVFAVALSGNPAPGAGENAVFTSFDHISVSASGIVAFQAALTGADEGCEKGLFAGDTDEIQLVACQGFPAPDLAPGVSFLYLGGDSDAASLIRGDRLIGFSAYIQGPGVNFDNDSGIWLGPPGGLRLLARDGDGAAGLPSYRQLGYLSNATLALNGTGQMTFLTELLYGGEVIVTGMDRQNLRVVARTSEPAPGTLETFSFLTSMVQNESGVIAFRGQLTGPHSTSEGIWLGGPHEVKLAVRKGDFFAGRSVWYIDSPPALNDDGQIAFVSRGPTVWVGAPGALQPVAIAGEPVPGTNSILHEIEDLALGRQGRVLLNAFANDADGEFSNRYGLWAGPPGGFGPVAQVDDPAPGHPGRTFSWVRDAHYTDFGAVAFTASLKDSPVDIRGVWLRRAGGTLAPIVTEGDVLEVGPGDWRVVLGASLSPRQGRLHRAIPTNRSALYPNGAAGRVLFDNGSSGVFLARTAMIDAAIDVKPWTKRNRIIPGRGLLLVGLMTTEFLDAVDVDVSSLRFGPSEAKPLGGNGIRLDLNRDRAGDLLMVFRTSETGILCGDKSAILAGETLKGLSFAGADSIATVRCQP